MTGRAADGAGRRPPRGRASIDALLDQPEPPPPPRARRPRRTPPAGTSPAPPARPVELRVVWGDLCRVKADVHVVGHYQGVMPTSAEAALDAAISGADPTRRVIAEHTRRQWFLGDFGHVNYFPSGHDVVRLGAVAGMGRPGTFTEARCTRLAENLLVELCALGSAERVATVGIGSGAGNLSIEQTARALAGGFAAGLQSSRMRHPCTHIDVVEYDRLRAERFRAALGEAVTGLERWLRLAPEMETGKDGGLSFASASVYALEAMARGAAAGDGTTDGLLGSLDGLGGPELGALVIGRLQHAAPHSMVTSAEVTFQRAQDGERAPVRMSVLDSGNGRSLRVAAITGTATVPERQIDVDATLIDEIVGRMSPPDPANMATLAELMSRMVLPSDLQTLVSADAPLVFEVDRRTAQIHWELVVDLVRPTSSTVEGADQPLVLQTSVSRQLRTSYSRVPALEVPTAQGLNVLLVGDPGGEGLSLPGARREAEAVHAALAALGVEVTMLVGAPPKDRAAAEPPPDPLDAPGPDEAETWAPAARLDVLGELLSGRYQIVHYCGHGTFDPEDQRRAGWVFADGLLTSRELAQLGTPPRLVVANACFTSRLGGGEAGLTPGLAEEFLRCGVGNYVGAAWKVSDDDAVAFSTTFYQQLLGPAAATMGTALTAARTAVWDSHAEDDAATGRPAERGTTWAAYQHYGDPTDQLRAERSGARDGS